MNIRVLGTLSPYPKENSNCVGYLLTNNVNKILVDCGTASARLLKFPEDLNNLTIIISHLHKDHFSDLFSIIYASYVNKKIGLLTYTPKLYIPKKSSVDDYNYLKEFCKDKNIEVISYDEDTIITIEDIKITFKQTNHSIPTYAMNMENKDKKISYSADTGYDETLIPFFNNADILICESSFLNKEKGNNIHHLTATEAALLGKKSNVKQLVLTHFWPENDKKEYLKEAQIIFNNTTLAQENMIL